MNECHYLYALARADSLLPRLGAGVDPRFPVELVTCRQTAAVVSRVGLDKFDLSKLESTSTDFNWLSQVAVRHNQIVSEAARHEPVLPLRLGVLFRSRESMLAKLSRWEADVVDFLDSLADRQEWAAKLYLDRRHGEDDADPAACVAAARAAGADAGRTYLTQKRTRQREQQAGQQQWREEVQSAETALLLDAYRYCRVRPLPGNLTGRQEKMLWNAAFLVPRSSADRWLLRVDGARSAAADKGLLLEVSGPWPPYHFCPALES